MANLLSRLPIAGRGASRACTRALTRRDALGLVCTTTSTLVLARKPIPWNAQYGSRDRLLGFTQSQTSYLGSTPGPTTTSSVNYTLDAAGNLTSDGLRSFTYDASNRLAKVQLTQSPEAAKISYLHNALGQRVFKSEPQVAQTAPNASTLGTPFVNWLQSNFGWLFAQAQANATLGQSYIYDDGQLGATPMLLGEYGNGSSQTLGRSEYLWLPQDDGTTMPIGLYTNSRLYALHADHLNTPRQITDDANKVAWQLPYSAFGDNKPTGVLAQAAGLRLKATVPAVTFNLRFPGQYFDEESNLAYNYFRSYQASQGRYTQSDPIGLSGDLNRFGYVEGNPLGATDPLGLDATVWRFPNGPTNGNWGGRCWSGGQQSCGDAGPGTRSPTDSADACYQRHDNCYAECGNNAKCIQVCDHSMVDELRVLPNDPRKWPHLPRP